jgi:hypothetical protein
LTEFAYPFKGYWNYTETILGFTLNYSIIPSDKAN